MTEEPKELEELIAKYITRESHKGSVNRIRILLAEDIEALVTQQTEKAYMRGIKDGSEASLERFRQGMQPLQVDPKSHTIF